MEAPELYHSGYYQQCTPERRHTDPKPGDHFIIEDLLDFSNEEDAVIGGDGTTFDNITGNSTDSSIVTVVDSCNSSLSGYGPNFSNDLTSRSFPDPQFSSDLCVPYDDIAELEWLSNIVEESFSSEDLQKLQLISGMKARTTTNEAPPENNEFQPEANRNDDVVATFRPEMSVRGKARSKRSRAAPNKWSSRLLVLSPTMMTTSSTSESDIGSNNSGKTTTTTKGTTLMKKKEISDTGNSDGRRCLHCATDKTPQWRTGPMGPKTLCNACGVRYKSGRLVPEYRPASSPTFVLAQHSNSHRKVLELRRQKEMREGSPHHHHHHQQHYLHPNTMFDDSGCDDYLIHHHTGPDYRQLI